MKKPERPLHTTISHCTFTNLPASGEAVVALARAIEANAQACAALAQRITEHQPMLNIGVGKDE